jgi:molecular chaperone GrpE
MNPEYPNPHAVGPEADAVFAAAVATASDSLRQELSAKKDSHLRLAADFANFKRRTHQEAESRALAQKESFIHELLPVLDNLERALASGASPGSQSFYQGVEMTTKKLRQLLRQHGIEIQESAGLPFDPRQHEAVCERHDPTHPDHAILEILQHGYRRGEKVFRPAKVVVNSLLTR